MSSTFSRAVAGFLILTLALGTFAYTALWTLDVYTPGSWWGPLVITVLSMVIEMGIFMSTLYEPIYEWIEEPKKAAKRARYNNALYTSLNTIYDTAAGDDNKFNGKIPKDLWEPARMALANHTRNAD